MSGPRYSHLMREVFDALERLCVRYFVTGSVAASVHGVLRQTHDTDVVVDLTVVGFRQLAQAFEGTHSVADPVGFGDVAMASIIDRATADKVDLILRPPGPFDASAMARRRRHDVPGLGPMWVASAEDVILAKLRWSEGTSELQLRDCSQLLTVGGAAIDQAYLDRWAATLGVEALLARVRDAA